MQDCHLEYTVQGILCESLVQDCAHQDLTILGFDADELEPWIYAEGLSFGFGVDCPEAYANAWLHLTRFPPQAVACAVAAELIRVEEYERGAHVDRCVDEDLVRKHEGA